MEDRPKRIKGELFAFDSIEVDPLLDELQRHKFILRYEVEGYRAIQILEFAKHQNPHFKEAPSVIPPPQSPGLYTHSMTPKPGALPPFNDPKAPDEHQPLPGKPGALTSIHSISSPPNPADSLIPDSLIPDSSEDQKLSHTPLSSDSAPEAPPSTAAGRACSELKRAGCIRLNPSHPDLLAALSEGVTAQELVDAYREKPTATNPFVYAITVARALRAEGASSTPQARAGPNGRTLSESKTFNGLKKLQGLKSDETVPTRLAPERNPGRTLEARDAEP